MSTASVAVVRAFRRDDRDQLAALVNAHIAAVVPGGSASVHQVLSQLEREPGEYVVDPWVVGRRTLVAEMHGRLTAAAHLLRYGDGDHVGAGYRSAGELRWLLSWPDSPSYPDAGRAARQLLQAAVRALKADGAVRLLADFSLPAPGVYGLPEQWPHIAALLAGAGFQPEHWERVHLAEIAALERPFPPLPGLVVIRNVGGLGTVLAGMLGERRVGWIEVCALLGDAGRGPDHRWADIGNLWVEPDLRRRGLGRWLLGQAADWLRLGGADRLLSYTNANPVTRDEVADAAFHDAVGFINLTTTARSWQLPQD